MLNHKFNSKLEVPVNVYYDSHIVIEEIEV